MIRLTEAHTEILRDNFRSVVLEAMDEAMKATYKDLGIALMDPQPGAQDHDLPSLFKALDTQFAFNIARMLTSDEDEMEKADQAYLSRTYGQ